MKIQSFKGHTDPPGLSGDLLEFRMIHDAFVLAPKCNGVAAACASGMVCAAPVAATANGKNHPDHGHRRGHHLLYLHGGGSPVCFRRVDLYCAADPGGRGPAAGLRGEVGDVSQWGGVREFHRADGTDLPGSSICLETERRRRWKCI